MPLAASGPVSDIEKPILIGLPLWAAAEATNGHRRQQAGGEPARI